MNYQIAFKIGGEWYPLGLVYAKRETAEARIARMHVSQPHRETRIVETEDDANA